MSEQLNTVNTLAKSKRKSPVDTPMILGIVLIPISFTACYFFQDSWLLALPIISFIVGISMIIYSIKMHNYFCKNAPEMLLPIETQVQNRILSMILGDDISEKNKVDIIKQISGRPSNLSLGEGENE